MSKKLSLFIFPFFFLTTNLFSQKFEAGIITGINISALNEDFGSHFGINTGLKGRYNLNKNWAASLELLYSRNGEYALPEFYPNIVYDRIKLNYIEIPVNAEWKVYAAKDLSPRFTFGFAVTSLLNFYAEDTSGANVTEFITWKESGRFKDLSVQGQLGSILSINEHLKFNIKLSNSLVYKELEPTLTFRGIWMFS